MQVSATLTSHFRMLGGSELQNWNYPCLQGPGFNQFQLQPGQKYGNSDICLQESSKDVDENTFTMEYLITIGACINLKEGLFKI